MVQISISVLLIQISECHDSTVFIQYQSLTISAPLRIRTMTNTFADICGISKISTVYSLKFYKISNKNNIIFISKNDHLWGSCSISIYSLGWSGGAKVLCILHHWGVQLILAYSWARPAILVVGKGRGGMFLFLLFLHFHSCSSFFPVPLFHLLYSLFYLFSPFLLETTQNDPQGLTCR